MANNNSKEELNIDNLRNYLEDNNTNIIKTYKLLTEILETKYTENSDRKKKQLEYFKYYFSFKIVGQKITILEIYDKPRTVVSSRKTSYKYNIGQILPHLIEKHGQALPGFKYKIWDVSAKRLYELLGFYSMYWEYRYDNRNYLNDSSLINSFSQLQKDIINNQTPFMSDEHMLKWAFNAIYSIPYKNVKKCLESFNAENTIKFKKGYELVNNNYSNFIFVGDTQYKILLSCEEKALENTLIRVNDEINLENEYIAKRNEQNPADAIPLRRLKSTITPFEAKGRYKEIFYEEFNQHATQQGIYFDYCNMAYRLYLSPSFVLTPMSDAEIEQHRYSLNNSFMRSLFNDFKNNNPTESDICHYMNDLVNLSDFLKINYPNQPDLTQEDFMEDKVWVKYKKRQRCVFKNACYNTVDMARVQLIIAILVCLTKDSTLQEIKSKKRLRQNLNKGTFILKTLP